MSSVFVPISSGLESRDSHWICSSVFWGVILLCRYVFTGIILHSFFFHFKSEQHTRNTTTLHTQYKYCVCRVAVAVVPGLLYTLKNAVCGE